MSPAPLPNVLISNPPVTRMPIVSIMNLDFHVGAKRVSAVWVLLNWVVKSSINVRNTFPARNMQPVSINPGVPSPAPVVEDMKAMEPSVMTSMNARIPKHVIIKLPVITRKEVTPVNAILDSWVVDSQASVPMWMNVQILKRIIVILTPLLV